MPRAVDTFIKMNEQQYRWFGELDPIRDGKRGSAKSMDMVDYSDLYGSDENDGAAHHTDIPPSNAFDKISNRLLITKIMRENKEKIKVVGKCDCVGVKKVLHHPDNNDPLTVTSLCCKCHVAEHKRIRLVAKQEVL
jgi:hypothetical protein